MPETFSPSTWADGPGGGTPITAAQLNRIEAGIESMDDRIAAIEDLRATVYAIAPPTGLAAIAADGSTNDASTLQTLLNYVSSTWGGGRVVLPSGKTIKCNSGLTLPAKVALVSDESTVLNFTGMTTSGTAITVNDTDFSPMRGVRLLGPQSTRLLTDTSKGVSVTGVRLRFYDCMVKNFGRGWDWAHSNTWLISLIGGSIEECGTCLYNDNVTAGASNAGEQMTLDNITLFNSTRALDAAGNGVHLNVTNCALDYCTEMGRFSDAWVYFTGCHIESNGSASNTYLFKVTNNSKVSFANTDVIMGSGTNPLNYLFDPTQPPFNFGNGQAHFSNTKIYAQNPSGGDVTWYSEALATWPSGQTTQTIFTPFPIRWAPVTAQFVAQDFRTQDSATLRVTSLPSNGAVGQVTMTASAAPSGDTFYRMRFG